MQPLYNYNATITNVVDGDTVDATVDLGFSIFTNIRFRLYGVDTPEKNDKDPIVRLLAINATKFIKDNLLGKVVTIQSVAKDKYGRWLAKIRVLDDESTINEQLVALGIAKAYFGDNKINLNW